MMNPVLVPFMAALVADRNFKHEILEAVSVYAHGWAEANDSKDADEDGYYRVSPRWPCPRPRVALRRRRRRSRCRRGGRRRGATAPGSQRS